MKTHRSQPTQDPGDHTKDQKALCIRKTPPEPIMPMREPELRNMKAFTKFHELNTLMKAIY